MSNEQRLVPAALDAEELRSSYKPARVRLLLVGESAPAAGTFFYRGDSLCRYTQKAFAEVFPEVQDFSGADFLQWFKCQGCFLDDLCLNPVNDLDDTERKQQRAISVPSLGKRIRLYRPEAIVAIMKGIRKHVENATIQSELDDVQPEAIPFAANGNQNRYIAELTTILVELKEQGFFQNDQSEYCFAYGSNMDEEQIKSRCPDSVFVGVGLLQNHRLGYTYFSQNRQCGVADIIPAANEKVFGAVYKLSASDWRNLDKREGRGSAYERRPYKIHLIQENRVILADAYYVIEPKTYVPPNEEYLRLINDAARKFGFPEEYIGRIMGNS